MDTICNKYQPRKCWQSGDIEDDVRCLGDCSRCSLNDLSNTPSFGELINGYVKYCEKYDGTVRRKTMFSKLYALNSLFKFTNIELSDKITSLTDEVWQDFTVNAKSHLKTITIKGIGERIHSLLSKNSKKFFKTVYHWNNLTFPDLSFDAKSNEWISLTKEQRMKIRDYQFGLFELSDPRKYLCVTAAWERGQRKCDALRNHWSQFQEHDGAIWWPYTSVKNGKSSNWPVDPDTWRMLMIAKRKLKNLKVHHLGKFEDSYLRIRNFDRNEVATNEIWDNCGDDMRNIMGWNGSKSMHNLRKDACDTVFQNLGVEEAEEFSTDTAKTLRKHYIAKKHINSNIQSIAKM